MTAKKTPTYLGYASHGNGTFNINPTGGTDGFYIGDESLTGILYEREIWSVTNTVNSPSELQIDFANGREQAFFLIDDENIGYTVALKLPVPSVVPVSRCVTWLQDVGGTYYDCGYSIDVGEDSNVNADSVPDPQPWCQSGSTQMWRLEWMSPPGSSKWYLVSTNAFPQ